LLEGTGPIEEIMMRTAPLLVTVLAAGCAAHTASPTLTNHATAAAPPAPIERGLRIAGTDRTGGGRGEQVQASAERAFGDVPGSGVVPAIDLDVALTAIDGAPRAHCTVAITATRTADHAIVAPANGGATVGGASDAAIADCVDATLDALRPKIAQLVADRMDADGARALADNPPSYRVRMYEFEGEIYEGDAPGVAPAVVQRIVDKATIRRFVKAHDRAFELCYAAQQSAAPGVEGTVTVEFIITPAGTVRAARATTFVAQSLDTCVVRSFQGLVFPESDAVTHVVYPITFRAPASP
jgi:hypothetical protein